MKDCLPTDHLPRNHFLRKGIKDNIGHALQIESIVPFLEINCAFLVTVYRIMYTFVPIRKHLFFT